jgi:TonB family protein
VVFEEEEVQVEDDFIPESEMIYIPNPIFAEHKVERQEVVSTPSLRYPNQKVKKLYGEEFLSYTPAQKSFIEDKLDEIHRITQNTLSRRGYPGGAISGRTGQEGTNVVSFYLHPNGDISELKLQRRVGYTVLDENTIETIKSAYKDYPYPQEKTKMIFFVEYSIFGY